VRVNAVAQNNRDRHDAGGLTAELEAVAVSRHRASDALGATDDMPRSSPPASDDAARLTGESSRRAAAAIKRLQMLGVHEPERMNIRLRIADAA